MRTSIIYFVLTILVMAVLIFSNIVDSLFVFLLSGSVPGTPIALSPTVMMVLLAAIAWLTFTYAASASTSQFLWLHRLKKRNNKRDTRMPKRRYSRI